MNIYSLLKSEITQQDLLNHYNATIFYDELPQKINGLVFCYKNINTIIVNKNISFYSKRKTILHELAHIELNQLQQIDKDLFSFKINKYEDEADDYLKKIFKKIKE